MKKIVEEKMKNFFDNNKTYRKYHYLSLVDHSHLYDLNLGEKTLDKFYQNQIDIIDIIRKIFWNFWDNGNFEQIKTFDYDNYINNFNN